MHSPTRAWTSDTERPTAARRRGSRRSPHGSPWRWVPSQHALLRDRRPCSRCLDLRFLVVPFRRRTPDPVAVAEPGAVRVAGDAAAGETRPVDGGQSGGRRHTPRSNSCVGARRGRSRCEPVPARAWRRGPRSSARLARHRLTGRAFRRSSVAPLCRLASGDVLGCAAPSVIPTRRPCRPFRSRPCRTVSFPTGVARMRHQGPWATRDRVVDASPHRAALCGTTTGPPSRGSTSTRAP